VKLDIAAFAALYAIVLVSGVKAAIEETQGKRLILGTGCVLPLTAPYGNIMAARRAVEDYD